MIQDLIHKALANAPIPITVLPGGGNPLAEKIKSGDLHLSDIPAFISYFIEMAIILAPRGIRSAANPSG